MKRNLLALACFLLLVSATVYALDKLEVINKPSAEMQLLRKTEKALALPPDSFRRIEDDKGCHKDSKGAPQCDRSIFFYYKSDQYWSALQAKLSELGWKNVDAGDGTYRAWNNQADTPVCLNHSNATTEEGSYVRLSAKTDNNCKYIIEQH